MSARKGILLRVCVLLSANWARRTWALANQAARGNLLTCLPSVAGLCAKGLCVRIVQLRCAVVPPGGSTSACAAAIRLSAAAGSGRFGWLCRHLLRLFWPGACHELGPSVAQRDLRKSLGSRPYSQRSPPRQTSVVLPWTSTFSHHER